MAAACRLPHPSFSPRACRSAARQTRGQRAARAEPRNPLWPFGPAWRAHLSHAARMTWTFILVLSPCRSVYSFGGAHARIGNITPWASWRPSRGPPCSADAACPRVLEVGVRSVCGQTYMPRSAHPALRLPSSGRRTVELGARCAARRADAANHCGIGDRGGPGPNVCGPRAGRRRGAGVSRPSAPAKRGPRARPLVR
jgi:hypothetical protein